MRNTVRPSLHQMARRGDWEGFINNMEYYEIDELLALDSIGETVMHLAVVFGASFLFSLVLLLTFTSIVVFIFLFHIFFVDAPVFLFRDLHSVCPVLVSTTSAVGMLPFHYACYLNSDYDVLAELLDLYPGAANARITLRNSDMAPFDMLWIAFVTKNQRACLVDKKRENTRVLNNLRSLQSIMQCRGELEKAKYVKRWWKKIELIFRYTYHGAEHDLPDQVHVCKMVHAISYLSCNFYLLELALKFHPDQAHEVDDEGRLPLHIACSDNKVDDNHDPMTCAVCCNNIANIYSKNFGFNSSSRSTIDILLNVNSKAAMEPAPNGRLPIFNAIAQGIKWYNGIESLVKAAPTTLAMKDKVEDMYAFQLAAVSELSDITTIYWLLLSNPNAVSRLLEERVKSPKKRRLNIES